MGHRGMTRPQVADGGVGLQIWRIAASMLNKQSETAEKGYDLPSLWDVGGKQSCQRKKAEQYEVFRRASCLRSELGTECCFEPPSD